MSSPAAFSSVKPSAFAIFVTVSAIAFAVGFLKVKTWQRDCIVSGTFSNSVVAITGAPKAEVVAHIIEGFSAGDGAKALSAVGEAVKANSDIAVLLMILIDRMRMLLMLRYAPALGTELIADLTDTEQKFLTDLATDTKSKINSETLRKLLIANIETAKSPVPQLPLELAIIELTAT